MSNPTLQRTVLVTNPQGFHMRPAAAFAELAGRFQSTVTVSKDGRLVNGKSLLELLFLAAEQGSELVLQASGPDAGEALDALAGVLAAPADEEAPPPCCRRKDETEEGRPSEGGLKIEN
jgi:phosphotransferase system HPr (HPr) family protein